MPGPAEVSWAGLALDYEAFAGWALSASPDHRLWGTRLPLGERAQILRTAAGLVERHLVAHGLLPPPPRGGGTALALRQEAPAGAAQEGSACGSAAQPPAWSG